MTPPTPDTGEKPLRIVRGRVDEVRVYEVTDAELERLEKGSPESLNFNAGIFFLALLNFKWVV